MLVSLMYHHVQDRINVPFNINPTKLEEHIIYLLKNDFNIIFPGEIGRDNRKNIILTFDDGYKNFYEFAYPILYKHKIKAVLGVITSRISTEINMEYCNWKEIREMADSNLIDIASHSHFHSNRCHENYKNLMLSKRLIEEKTGKVCKTFIAPYGCGSFINIFRSLRVYRHIMLICNGAINFNSSRIIYRMRADDVMDLATFLPDKIFSNFRLLASQVKCNVKYLLKYSFYL
jgi:peptidoglycan/xylan/chitin deacetylase (PgdA/CDA1 family)